MYNDILYFNFCLLGLIVLFFSFLFMVVPSWYHKYLAPPFNKEILLLLLLLIHYGHAIALHAQRHLHTALLQSSDNAESLLRCYSSHYSTVRQ